MDDTATATAKAAEAIAKSTGQALEIVHDTGGYLRHVFGEVPADVVGVLGGAWLHERHIRIRDALRRRTEQILLDDSRKLADLASNSGVDVTLEIVPEMQHVFQFLAGTAPEGDAAIRRLADWARPKLALV